MSEISFTVAGRPMPQPKPRTKGKARFYPPTYTEYRQQVVDRAQEMAYELHERGEPWDACRRAYDVRIRFYQPDCRNTDLDRLTATIFDAMKNAGLIEDDRYIDGMNVRRRVDPVNPRVEVTLIGRATSTADDDETEWLERWKAVGGG